ncbi:MAG: hypothetical protein WA906_08335 [Pacificimonas sp.]
MNRVRLGFTGLAVVFLLALLIAALTGPNRPAVETAPNETLATLGVAPGSEEAQRDTDEDQPVPVPTPALPVDPLPLPADEPLDELPLQTDGELTEI